MFNHSAFVGKNLAQKGIVLFGVVILISAAILIVAPETPLNEDAAWSADRKKTSAEITETLTPSTDSELSSQVALKDSIEINKLVIEEVAGQEKGFASISGYVLREDRSPVTDAKVKAVKTGELERSLHPDQFEGFETTSAGDGWFAFKRVPLGKYSLVALSTDACGKTSAMAANPTDHPSFKLGTTEIILKPGGTISGRVVDPEGNPVPKAWVMPDHMKAAVTHTGKDGRFEMGPLALDLYSITAGAENLASGVAESVPVGKTDLEIQLVKGGYVEGEVYCKDTPLAGVSVRVSYYYSSGFVPCEDLSDKNGKFRIGPLREGQYSLEADSSSHVPVSKPRITLSRNESLDGIRLNLKKGGGLSGRVVDGADNNPVAGAWVYALTNKKRSGFNISTENSACTDAEGKYHIPRLAPQEYRVGILSTGPYQSALWNDGARVKVIAGEVAENIDFQLLQGATVQLQVNVENGNPVTGAQIRFESSEPDKRYARYNGTTVLPPRASEKGNGSYLIQGISPGVYKLTAYKQGMGRDSCSHAVSSTDEVASLALTLDSTFELPGVVLDENGKGIAGALVRSGSRGYSDVAVTDSDGAFVIGGNTEQGYRYFTVVADGYNTFGDSRSNLSPNSDPLEFVMVAKGTLTVSGRVKDDKGNPLAHVQMTAEQESVEIWIEESAYTSDDGTYEITGLLPGPVYVYADASKGVRRGITEAVEAGASNVDFVLERLGTVKGTVVDEDGEPASSFTTSVRSKKYYRGRKPSKHCCNGSFELTHVPPGQFQVSVETDEGKAAKSDWLDMAPGGVVEEVKLTLSQVGAISGTVCELGTNAPISGASLYLQRGAQLKDGRKMTIYPWMRADAVTGGDGTFLIEGLKPDQYILFAAHSEYQDCDGIDVVVEPDKTASDVQVMLTTGPRILGYVFMDGEGIPGINITASKKSGGRYKRSEAVTGKDGFYCLKSLAPGEYTLYARLDSEDVGGTKTRSKKVTLGVAGDQRADFSFGTFGAIAGRVFAFGEPISGVRVSINTSGNRSSASAGDSRQSNYTRTDTMGYFEATRLPSGEYSVYTSFSRDGKRFYETRKVELVGARTIVDFRFGEDCTCEVYGNVYAAGMPVPEQEVELKADSFSGSIETDRNGFFRFTDVPSGKVSLKTRIWGNRCSTRIGKKLNVSPGASVRADLTVQSGGGSIYGRVEIQPESKSKNYVYISSANQGSASTCSYNCTVVDGDYCMENLSPGMYTVTVYRPWMKSKKVHVSAKRARRVDFEYEQGEAEIAGTITVPDMKLEESGKVKAYLFEPGACPFKEGEALHDVSFSQGLVAELSHKHDYSFSCKNLPAGLLDVVCVRHKDDKTIKMDIKRVKLYDEECLDVTLDVKD